MLQHSSAPRVFLEIASEGFLYQTEPTPGPSCICFSNKKYVFCNATKAMTFFLCLISMIYYYLLLLDYYKQLFLLRMMLFQIPRLYLESKTTQIYKKKNMLMNMRSNQAVRLYFEAMNSIAPPELFHDVSTSIKGLKRKYLENY